MSGEVGGLESDRDSPPAIWIYGEEVEVKQERWRRQDSSTTAPARQPRFIQNDIEEQKERWKKSVDADRSEPTTDHQVFIMSHANALQHRGGLDFNALARGQERNYSTSYLINLDPDLLSLCGVSAFDMSVDALIGHTKRVFQQVRTKSRREINQFCFGSAFVQLNPNYRKFDRMDPLTWKKEGIASQWAGIRGLRKICCKVCCTDFMCQGCRKCNGCLNGPVRGNYDGLVVLSAITKETLPNVGALMSSVSNVNRRKEERYLDHENFAVALETVLTSHFMYGNETEVLMKCVPTSRMAVMSGDAIPEDSSRKLKKYVGYVVYVAYRLDAPGSYVAPNAGPKASRATSNSQFVPATIPEEDSGRDRDRDDDFHFGKSRDSSAMFQQDQGEEFDDVDYRSVEDYGHDPEPRHDDEEEDEKLLEELEDKQLLARIAAIEAENHNLKEQVWKLEHGRTWLENRLTSLEFDVTSLKNAISGKKD